MINIRLVRKNNNFIKFEVCGHSAYDILGRDIVCAAVSTITQSVIIGLERVVDKDFYYRIDDKNAFVFVDISCYDKGNMNKAQILLNTFKYTIDGLILDYGKYIKMKIEEEQ